MEENKLWTTSTTQNSLWAQHSRGRLCSKYHTLWNETIWVHIWLSVVSLCINCASQMFPFVVITVPSKIIIYKSRMSCSGLNTGETKCQFCRMVSRSLQGLKEHKNCCMCAHNINSYPSNQYINRKVNILSQRSRSRKMLVLGMSLNAVSVSLGIETAVFECKYSLRICCVGSGRH